MTNDYLLTLSDVLDITQWSKATLYRRMRAGRFPKPLPTGETRALRFRNSDVQQWIEDPEACAVAQ